MNPKESVFSGVSGLVGLEVPSHLEYSKQE